MFCPVNFISAVKKQILDGRFCINVTQISLFGPSSAYIGVLFYGKTTGNPHQLHGMVPSKVPEIIKMLESNIV